MRVPYQSNSTSFSCFAVLATASEKAPLQAMLRRLLVEVLSETSRIRRS